MSHRIVVTLPLTCSGGEMRERFLRPLQSAIQERGIGRFDTNLEHDGDSTKATTDYVLMFVVRDFREGIDFLKTWLTEAGAPDTTTSDGVGRLGDLRGG